MALELGAELSLERLHVAGRGLVALLAGVEHELAILVQRPFADRAIAESDRAADDGAGTHHAIELDLHAAGPGGGGEIIGRFHVRIRFLHHGVRLVELRAFVRSALASTELLTAFFNSRPRSSTRKRTSM